MRYLGTKSKILPIIDEFIRKNNIAHDGDIFCDAFSGTGAVGDYFKNRFHIISNDSLYASYAVTTAKLINPDDLFATLGFCPFDFFNRQNTHDYIQGFCYNNFAPTISGRMYFSDENAKLIDYIRDTIDMWFAKAAINQREYIYLIGSLIESVSKVSNVAGVYSAFLRTWDPRAIKRMSFIPVEVAHKSLAYDDNISFSEDVLDFLSHTKGDILYLDPPYTPTQYISQYHVLETIARNDHPTTHGVGAHRDNGNQISRWCKKEYVGMEFQKAIATANFKHILFSYSDAGIMSKEFIEKTLKRYAVDGSYKFIQIDYSKYKSTRAVNREKKENSKNKAHFEWLFYIEKKETPIYTSPLNYIGGKYDIIPFIRKYLPSNIDTFYDLFGGGANVSINVQAKNIIYNDINYFVKDLLQNISDSEISSTIKYIQKTIKKYGLEKGNKDAYYAFRSFYNSKPETSRNPLDLYLLICYGFEHQIRFNSKKEFNNPCGNSGFNQEMLEKLISFSFISKKQGVTYFSSHYSHFEDLVTGDDFVYCDPPYLISCGAYNDGKRGFNGWDEEQEKELLAFLLRLHRRGVRFMLSNMADRNGLCNVTLSTWIEENNFRVISNERMVKRNRQDRYEVIIINY